MNIDKDIEIVEKFIEETQEEYSGTLVDGKVYRIENIPLEFKPTKELANAISNVLSELEKYKKAYKLETYERQKFIDELEIYKKIVPFMADFINMYTLSGEENQYCHRVIDCQEIGGGRSCVECIIDWVKKEVEKDE